MVKLRLQRYGNKNNPFYRVVAADSRNKRDGRFIEMIGYYDPANYEGTVSLKEERVRFWLEKGAIATPTVVGILKKKGILAGETGSK